MFQLFFVINISSNIFEKKKNFPLHLKIIIVLIDK